MTARSHVIILINCFIVSLLLSLGWLGRAKTAIGSLVVMKVAVMLVLIGGGAEREHGPGGALLVSVDGVGR